MKRVLYFLFFTAVTAVSCKKEDPQTEDENHSPASTTVYDSLGVNCDPYLFKNGTYWIYENDSTGTIDSVVVDSVSTGFHVTIPSVHGTTAQHKAEYYKVHFYSFGTSEFYDLTMMNGYYARRFTGGYGNFSGQTIYIVGSPIGTSSGGMTITAKFPSFTLGINTFNNVDQAEIIAADQSLPEFAFDTRLYFCDSVGIIRKESHLSVGNTESWSLKRWNIIR